MLALNIPNLIAFCEAVRNYLETVECAEHISKDGQSVMCGLIDEGSYKMIQIVYSLHRALIFQIDYYLHGKISTCSRY